MSQSTDEDRLPLPAVFEHARTVYNLMEEEAKLVTHNVTEDGHEVMLIWEGHLTKLFQRLHLSVPYYTSVTRELKRMGCIAQKRRGGGNAPSQWMILREPTEELFRDERTRSNNTVTRRRDRLSRLEQQVTDLARDHAKIKDDYDTIIQILVDREQASA